jgi:predicted kinase
VPLDERLPPAAYTREASARVYETLLDLTRRAAAASQSVVVDAVFAREAERDEVAEAARDAGLRFDGLWLDAPAEVLRSRVAGRTGDVSDADVAVLERQLGYDIGVMRWACVDVSGGSSDAEARVRQRLSE